MNQILTDGNELAENAEWIELFRVIFMTKDVPCGKLESEANREKRWRMSEIRSEAG